MLNEVSSNTCRGLDSGGFLAFWVSSFFLALRTPSNCEVKNSQFCFMVPTWILAAYSWNPCRTPCASQRWHPNWISHGLRPVPPCRFSLQVPCFPVAQQWTGADPGFTYPNIGAPAYFRVADFEYAGIIQGWTIKEDEGGNPVYNVKLTDPRAILDHVQVILDTYEGNTTLSGLYNLLNVYAYLEYTSGDCQDRVLLLHRK